MDGYEQATTPPTPELTTYTHAKKKRGEGGEQQLGNELLFQGRSLAPALLKLKVCFDPTTKLITARRERAVMAI